MPLPLILVLAVLVIAPVLYGLYRLSSSTAREIIVPFAGGELPTDEIRAALERMGCLVRDDGGTTITGYMSGDGLRWGQEVTVTAEAAGLRVRSRFSRDQIYGGSKNQENIDRFAAEWQRRAESRATALDPVARAASEAQARGVARSAVWGGGLASVAGLVLLLVVLSVPSRRGASPGSKFYLAGFALMALAYGMPRVWAGVARLRKRPNGKSVWR